MFCQGPSMASTTSVAPSETNELFKGVKYFLSDERNEEVKQLLKRGGASREFFVSNLVTHIVSSNTAFPEYNQAKEMGIPIVKPDWVVTCVESNAVLPIAPFSSEKNKLFSNIVACPSKIPTEDREALWAMVTFYGGKWQSTFNSNCTHLLVPNPDGDKYEAALKNIGNVKIVIPDWIVDCIKAKKLLDEEQYAPVATASQTTVEATPPEGSILTPDNNGVTTTTATLSANVKSVTPSSLLTPETPVVNKSESDNVGKDSENLSGNSEDLFEDSGTNEDEQDKIDSNTDSAKRQSRQAAKFAIAKLREAHEQNEKSEDDRTESDDKDDNYQPSEEPKEKSGGESALKSSDVVEIVDDENNELNNELYKKSLEKKTVVVSTLLSDCVLYFSDYPETVSSDILEAWITVVKQYGGAIVPTYSSEVTHFVTPHQLGTYYNQALSEGKHMVTAYWLNDVISAEKLFCPKISLHLPVPFKDKVPRCRNMMISVTGFEGEERTTLKNMIKIIGAKYNNIFTKSNTHLICRSETGEKYQKAKEWGVACANARWLGDVVTGGCDYPVNMKRYQTFCDESLLEINIILARDLLESWKGFEEKQDSSDKKRKLEMLENEMKELEYKKPRIEEAATTPQTFKSTTNWPNVARVVFTGLNPTVVGSLTEKLKSLGGEPCASVKLCTHIVASKIMRTIKFLTGISVCQYIVNPEWIEESYRAGHYVDEKQYILRDFASEKLYGMCLPESIEKAQSRPLFKGMTIYVTPNVRPEQSSMAEIVGCAGGRLLVQMPVASSFKLLAEQKTEQDQPAFVCVTCDDDLHMCKEMKLKGIGIYNVEFVLSGILKQQLDLYRYKL